MWIVYFKEGKFLFLAAIFLFMVNCDSLYSSQKSNLSKKNWATKLEIDGLDNLYKVTDSLYRSAQPKAIGIENIEKLGVGTIISLRSKQKDEKLSPSTNLNLIHIKMRAWKPEYETAVLLMRILDPNNPNLDGKPVLVHCYHGADRTGFTIALYRIVYENWTQEEAIDEMINGGYGYHKIWKDIIKFLKELNIDEFKNDVLNN